MCSTLFGAFLFRARPRREFFLCLEDVKKKRHDDYFFKSLGGGPPQVQTWVRSQGFNSSEIHLIHLPF